MLSASLPFWPIDPSLADSPWFNFQLDFVRCLWAILPATLLWGASFPLALAALATPGDDPARLVGRVYAANTVGAIVGSLVASLVLVAGIGSQHTQQLLILLCGVSALVVLEPVAGAARRRAARGSRFAAVVAASSWPACGLLMRARSPSVPGLLVAYGRFTATRRARATCSTWARASTRRWPSRGCGNGVLNYHNAGKVQASSEPQDMRLQRMLGHLTTLVPAHPKSVLVIGCGAGVTAGAVSIDPARREGDDRRDRAAGRHAPSSTYFSALQLRRHPQSEGHGARRRRAALPVTTKEKFDAITSDPLDPWVKGAAMLYTKEFFELGEAPPEPGRRGHAVRAALREQRGGGEERDRDVLRGVPERRRLGATRSTARATTSCCSGQVEPIKIDVDAVEAKLDRPEYRPIAQSLARDRVPDRPIELLAHLRRAARRDLAGWLKDAAINRDRNLRLQYLAGMGFNLRAGGKIYNNMLAYRRQPQGIFYGSPASVAALYHTIENPPIR